MRPDYAPDLRGLGVKLYLPNRSRTDIVPRQAKRRGRDYLQRERVRAGTLELTGPDNPVLRFRAGAYSESVARRTAS